MAARFFSQFAAHWLKNLETIQENEWDVLTYLKHDYYVGNLETDEGEQELNKAFELKSGPLYTLDIKRRKNRVELSLNGKYLVAYQYKPTSKDPDAWNVGYRIVSQKVKIRSQRIK